MPYTVQIHRERGADEDFEYATETEAYDAALLLTADAWWRQIVILTPEGRVAKKLEPMMGAELFSTTIVAKNAEEAFRLAQDSARWEHGHGGYSGSIAEKHGFTPIALPARMTAKKFIGLALDASQHDGSERDYHAEHVAWLRANGTKAAAAREERELRKAQREDERFWKKIPPAALPAVRAAAQVADDKWGPAVCVELRGAEATAARNYSGKRGKVFTFFGYASC